MRMRSAYSFHIILWNYMTGFFPLGYDWIYFLCINFLCLLLHGLPVEKHVNIWASCRKARISHIVYSPSKKALPSCLRRRWLPGSPCPLWTRMGNLLQNIMSFHDDRGLNGKTCKKKLHIAVEMTWKVLWPIGSSHLQTSTTSVVLKPSIHFFSDLLWFKIKSVNPNSFAAWQGDWCKTYINLLYVS